MREPEDVAHDVVERNIDHEELYRVPASEGYPFGHSVGFVMAEGWAIAVNWYDDNGTEQLSLGPFAVELGEADVFPIVTRWMITSNSAIDYGLEGPVNWDEQ